MHDEVAQQISNIMRSIIFVVLVVLAIVAIRSVCPGSASKQGEASPCQITRPPLSCKTIVNTNNFSTEIILRSCAAHAHATRVAACSRRLPLIQIMYRNYLNELLRETTLAALSLKLMIKLVIDATLSVA